jgi:hypothetical protein
VILVAVIYIVIEIRIAEQAIKPAIPAAGRESRPCVAKIDSARKLARKNRKEIPERAKRRSVP